MPVELPISTSPETYPAPPRAVVWLGLFVIFMLVGVLSTLLTWPKSEPTGSLWFWVRLLVLPALSWGVAYGLRLHYFDDETDRLRAEDEAQRGDREKAVRFASEPLAVLGCAYLSAAGSTGVAGDLAQGGSALGAQTSHAGDDGIRHTALALLDEEEGSGRYRACFEELLDLIADAVVAIPRHVPLDVRLQFSAEADLERLLQTWQSCWQQRELRPTRASLLPAEQGLMALDEWLDIRGGPALEKFTLFVSAQLYDTPPENSAEAAVALLLGWSPLAERREMKPLALLHRPLETDPTALNDAIPRALLWGQTGASRVNDLWQGGLEAKDKPALLQSMSDLSLGVSQTEALSGIHDIDTALGDPGVAAGWLAVALAIEHAAQSGGPQLIAWREGSLRLAVAQPVKQESEMESKA